MRWRERVCSPFPRIDEVIWLNQAADCGLFLNGGKSDGADHLWRLPGITHSQNDRA